MSTTAPPPQPPPDAPASDIGPFRLEGFVAAGAMGEVWRARHRQLDHEVAVKVITRAYAHEVRFRDGLRREVQAMAGLRHSGIAVVVDFGVFDGSGGRFAAGSPYFVMEMAQGGTLTEAIARGVDWPAARAVLLALLDALGHAHARGVVHRDLKPDNVLDFAPPGAPPRWKLVDFGIAHSTEGHATEGSDGVVGTPGYMAPEQFLGRWRDFGPWTDLYALGCIAHELVCGQRPFTGRSMITLAHQHMTAPLPPFTPRVAVPAGFEAWLSRLLAKSIHARFPCAADASAALRALGPRVPLMAAPPIAEGARRGSNTDATNPMAATVPEMLDASLNETQVAPAGATQIELLDTSLNATLAAPAGAATLPPTPAQTQTPTRVSRPGGGSQPSVPTPPVDELGALTQREAGRFAAPPAAFDFWADAPTDPASDALAAASIPLFGLRAAPFVGRRAERAAVWSALQGVQSTGRPAALILEGTAGAGKSRLAEWVCHRAAEIGAAQVLRARHGRQGGAAHGIGPMLMRHHQCVGLSAMEIQQRVAWLARLAQGQGRQGDGWDLEALAEVMLGDAGTTASATRGQPAQDRFGVLRTYLQIMGRERPVLIWLDDAHWSEEAVALVRFILRWSATAPCPVLFLLTVRSEDLVAVPTMRALLDELATLPQVQRFALAPFAHDEMQSLIGGRLSVDADLTARIARRSHGNPLFVVQLLGEWVAQGVLRATATGFEVNPGVVPTLPEDLHAVWTDRVAHLLAGRPTDDQIALQVAARLGLHVVRAEWQQACAAIGVDAPEALIAVMVEQGLARWADDGFAFGHGLLCESLERQAREGAWGRINQGCAAALQALGCGRPDQARLGRYLLEAGEDDAALAPLLTAALYAYGHAEIDEAFELLDQCDAAIERLGSAPEPAVRAWTLRGRICSHLGRREAAERWFNQSCTLAESAGLTALYAAALMDLAQHCRTYHASERAAELAREALARFEAVGDRAGAAWSRVQLAHVLTNGPDPASAEPHYTVALADFEALSDRTGMAQCQRGLGWLRQAAGDAEAASALFTQAHENLQLDGHRLLAMALVNDMADLQRAAGDLDAAEAKYRRALTLFDSVGHMNRVVVRLNLGMIALRRADFEGARSLAEQALRDITGDPYLRVAVHAQLLVCAAARGDLDAWARHFPPVAEGLDDAPEIELDDALSVEQAALLAQRNGHRAQAVAAARIGQVLWRRLDRPARAAAMDAIVEGTAERGG